MTCPDRATRSERIWSGLPCSRRLVPYLLRSPERSSYSNGPKTTLGAVFGWVPIAELRSNHNTLRLREFRVEVRFKAKCMDCNLQLSYSCIAVTETVNVSDLK